MPERSTNNNHTPSSYKILIALIIGLSAIISFYLIAQAYQYKFKQQEQISVTGGAEQNFISDLIVWNASFSKNDSDLQAAFAALKIDEQKVRNYMNSSGIPAADYKFSSVRIDKQYSTRYDESGRVTGNFFSGYQLTQSVKIESKNIQLVDKISREVTGLIQQGVELNSEPPAYYYTKLGDLKIDLLAEASADGKKRAETIAENSGINLGTLRKASMGIFQITGQNENEEYSYGGTFNTSSLNKTATITVRMEFDAD